MTTGKETIEQWAKEELSRLGGLPTPEEVIAYHHGELTPEQRENVRYRAILAGESTMRLLDESFPTEGAEPGDPDYLPDEEWPAHWRRLRRRMWHDHAWRVLRWILGALIVAALLAIGYSALAESGADYPRIFAK